MKTLQQEYQLIKEGKGNKDYFLKMARNMFPEYIAHGNDFNSAVAILTSKSLLSEAAGGVVTMNSNKPDWFKIFNTKLNEVVGVKDKEEYGDQNTFKADKEVETTLDKANFDNKDPKNIDNLYGQSFLMGYYTEMKDPKNADKTMQELKDIVLKNLAKDPIHYTKDGQFGIKGLGYTTEAPGLGTPKEAKNWFEKLLEILSVVFGFDS
mgnify:CR=1 FL=1